MRSRDHILSQDRISGIDGFLPEDIQACSLKAARAQRRDKRVVVHDRPAPDIHHDPAGRQRVKLGGADQAPRARGQRQAQHEQAGCF
jgi:hypothetical protein